jgi:hypothetical protein
VSAAGDQDMVSSADRLCSVACSMLVVTSDAECQLTRGGPQQPPASPCDAAGRHTRGPVLRGAAEDRAGGQYQRGGSGMEQLLVWTPRRGIAVVIGQVLLAASALLITGGWDAFDLGVVPALWLALLGVTLAVLGANWLNVAFWFWYPAVPATRDDRRQQAPLPLPEGALLINRAIIAFQFVGCGVALVLQVAAGVVELLAARSPQEASLGATSFSDNVGLASFILPFLGALLNYILSAQAHLIEWPPALPAASGSSAPDASRVRPEWFEALGTARETHTHVIGAVVLFLLPGLSVRFGQVLVHVAAGGLTLVVVAYFLRSAYLEVRHLGQVRRELAARTRGGN